MANENDIAIANDKDEKFIESDLDDISSTNTSFYSKSISFETFKDCANNPPKVIDAYICIYIHIYLKNQYSEKKTSEYIENHHTKDVSQRFVELL